MCYLHTFCLEKLIAKIHTTLKWFIDSFMNSLALQVRNSVLQCYLGVLLIHFNCFHLSFLSSKWYIYNTCDLHHVMRVNMICSGVLLGFADIFVVWWFQDASSLGAQGVSSSEISGLHIHCKCPYFSNPQWLPHSKLIIYSP